MPISFFTVSVDSRFAGNNTRDDRYSVNIGRQIVIKKEFLQYLPFRNCDMELRFWTFRIFTLTLYFYTESFVNLAVQNKIIFHGKVF